MLEHTLFKQPYVQNNHKLLYVYLIENNSSSNQIEMPTISYRTELDIGPLRLLVHVTVHWPNRSGHWYKIDKGFAYI